MAPQALREEVNQHVEDRPLRFVVKKDKPVPRPVTPRVDEPPEVRKCLRTQSDTDIVSPT